MSDQIENPLDAKDTEAALAYAAERKTNIETFVRTSPDHGTAYDIAGQGLANPLATLLSFAMMLRYSLDLGADADLVEAAVKAVLDSGVRTADIAGPGTAKVSTTGMGDAILAELDRLAA